MIEAILFDLDNTLIDRDRAFQSFLQDRVRDEHARERLSRLDQRGQGSRDKLFHSWNAGDSLDQNMDQARLSSGIAKNLFADAGLLSLLSQLGSRLGLGIITNGGSLSQRKKMNAAGLSAVIPDRYLLISEEVQLEKPATEIFLMASKRLKLQPSQVLYVGDLEEIDGVGARSAGMHFQLAHQPLTAESLQEIVNLWRIA
jgi:putative hydrolase of the HAD superfamily